MSTLDRAFIKAYSHRWRQPGDGARAERIETPSGDAQAPLTRIDRQHGIAREAVQADPAAASTDSPEGLYARDQPTLSELYFPARPETAQSQVQSLQLPDRVDSLTDSSSAGLATRFGASEPDATAVLRLADDPLPLPESGSRSGPLTKPLSSFAADDDRPQPLRALLEVDRFRWPREVDALCSQAAAPLDAFVSQFTGESRLAREKMFALASDVRGCGRTTISLCLARRAAARGLAVVLVEADFTYPALARRLGLKLTDGWEAVLQGRRLLSDVLIASRHDQLTLLPWRSEAAKEPSQNESLKLAELLGNLRQAFDLVLIDTGAAGAGLLAESAARAPSDRLDAVWLVHDDRAAAPAGLSAFGRKLRTSGVPVAGTIVNFSAQRSETAEATYSLY